MPRTIDSIVDSHRLARERINQGKSSWAYHVPIKPIGAALRANGQPTEAQAAKACQEIADLLKARLPKAWFDITNAAYDQTLDDIQEALDGKTVEEFAVGGNGTALAHLTAHVDALYDWANYARVWLGD